MIHAYAKDLMNKKFVSVQKSAPASELIGKLKHRGDDLAVVYDNGTYEGIVTKRSLFKKRHDLSKIRISSLVETVPALSVESTLLQVVDAILGSGKRTLPVMGNGKVLGMVSAMDVAMQIKKDPELKNKKAEEVASLKPFKVKKGTSLGRVFSIMEKSGVSRLPVVDNANKLVGIISYRDVMEKYLRYPVAREGGFRGLSRTAHAIRTKAFSPRKLDILKIPVESEMTANTLTATTQDSLSRILQIIQRHEISDVVLAKNGELEGIVTLKDLLRVFLAYKTERRNIQFVGIPELDPVDKAAVEQVVSLAYDRIERILNNDISLKVHVKTHNREGLRMKYSVHCKLDSSGLHIDGSSAKEGVWKFISALQDAISVVEKDLAKSLRKPRWKQV